jgi:hypothetical protein
MERQVTNRRNLGTESLDAGGIQQVLRRTVGSNRRVLLVGHAVGPLARLLTHDQCAVIAVEGDPDLAVNAMPFCERLLVGDPEQLDFDQELPSDRFDAIVLPGLESVRDPGALLESLTPLLSPRGRIIAAVLNGAHVGVRLALLQGELPTGAAGGPEARRLPLYFRDSVEQLFQGLGLDIMHLERWERALDDRPADETSLPIEVVDGLMRDPEALTERFVVVACLRALPELELIEHRLRKLVGERDGLETALDRLSAVIDAQSGHVDILEDAIGEVRDGAMRQDAELHQVAAELESRLETALRRGPGALSPDDRKRIRYEVVQHALRGAVGAVAAPGSIVMVVSRGDDALLSLESVEGWHFPQTADGVYAGHHPKDAQAAIAHFEMLRARGGEFLVIPATSLWWLEYYAAFRDHLLASHQLVYRNEIVGVIFAPRLATRRESA